MTGASGTPAVEVDVSERGAAAMKVDDGTELVDWAAIDELSVVLDDFFAELAAEHQASPFPVTPEPASDLLANP